MRSNKIATLLLTCSLLGTSVFATGSIPIYIEGKAINATKTPAYISETQRTMIPVRSVGEVLGLGIDWQTPYVILSGKSLRTGKMIKVTLNTKTRAAVINGKWLKEIIELKDGRSYITLRVLAEAFGYEVDWRNRSVYIELPEAPVQPSQPNNSKPETSIPEQPTTPATFNEQVLALVNKERQAVGLKSLSLDDALCKAALLKSQDMHDKGYFSHTSPTYGSPFEMLTQLGIDYRAAAENIAQGYTTPEAVVKGWMNSEGHRANILNAQYTHMGVGYVASGNYWTQLFIKQ